MASSGDSRHPEQRAEGVPPLHDRRGPSTDRRAHPDKELQRLNEALTKQVADLAREDRRKSEFLAILSHELRNPIHAIRTNAWVIAKRVRGDPEVAEAAGAIERQVSLLAKLLEDLLNVIRLGRETPFELQPHDARDLLKEAVDATRQRIEKRHHRLVLDLGEEALPVNVDAERVEQALMNILENAAKYTDPGGTITVTARRVLGMASLAVRDTGIGIAQEEIPSLFDLFKQGSGARHRASGGLGIGLHIAAEMVKEHGGRIEVQSAGVGLGTKFEVLLPLHSELPEEEPEDGLDGEDEAVAQQLTILVVDDNRDAADSLAKLLRAYGHEVWTAYDGLEAVDLALEKRPRVALIDIALPKIDGYQVAQRIGRTRWGRTMTLIAVTGWGLEDDKEKALAAGFDAHLTKPIDYEELEGILAKL